MTNNTKSALQAAYFSMEFALDARIPNYAGGLGILATDILKSCADKHENIVGVSLIYHQHSDPKECFPIEKFMTKLPETIELKIEDRLVTVGIYQYDLKSSFDEHTLPIYFLTTNLESNEMWDRDITKHLYASDQYTRIAQEIILGIGGVKMLRALGYKDIKYMHMNEGHSAFLTLEMLKENEYKDEKVIPKCTFTTHTPIKAGHDKFDYNACYKLLGQDIPWHIKKIATEEQLSMTHLALNLSTKTNSVSEKHREVCSEMFPGYKFENVTNGIHPLSWISDSMKVLFNKYLTGWEKNNNLLSQAKTELPTRELILAHQESKKKFIEWINVHRSYYPYVTDMYPEDYFDADTLTIGFARRFVPYKRPDLIFNDLKRLRRIGYRKLQLVFAGRCHQDDEFCNNLRSQICDYVRQLRGQVRVVVIPDYNIDISYKMITGCDVWLNNPIKQREASGTSGMKAALNGGLNLSILDGWWIEGIKRDNKSGWGFGDDSECLEPGIRNEEDAHQLYDCLREIVKEFYAEDREQWAERMKSAISLLGFFNTDRVVEEYKNRMWK